MTAAYQKVQEKKKDRWQDDDGDGKWYEKSDVDGKISKREKEEKKKNQKEEVEQVEEKATPESGTGKYYKEGKPTAQQLANRAKREKIKSLTNQGKHKEASALHNEENVAEDCAAEADSNAPQMSKGGLLKKKKTRIKEEILHNIYENMKGHSPALNKFKADYHA